MKENTIYNILIIACIIAIVAVTILIFTTKKSESFTELYFENHQNLLENTQFTYNYQITLDLDGTTKILKQEQITLNHNQKQPIYHQFKIQNSFKQGKITITLLNKKQSIHFWLK